VRVKRGEVYVVHVGRGADAPGSQQDAEGPSVPAVVLTRDAINDHSATVVVAPIVTAGSVPRLYPSDIRVYAPAGGLAVDGVILTAQVRSVPRTRLGRRLGVLDAVLIGQVDRALRITFALDDNA